MLPGPSILFYEASDGQRLALRRWECDDPTAEVVILHGIISHAGWYDSSSAYLAEHQFRVHFLERRGSGINFQQRGDVATWKRWLADLSGFVEQLPPGRPVILLGISWGAILATSFARRHAKRLAGLGLITPGLFSYYAANSAQRTALRWASRLRVDNVKVPIPLRSPELFTDNPTHQAFIAQDPLTLRHFTLRFAHHNVVLMRDAVSAPEQLQLPVLVMLASGDRITDNQATRDFVQRIGHQQTTVIEYPDNAHTLEFGENPQPYYEDLADWCRRVASLHGRERA